MHELRYEKIAKELNLSPGQVRATARLFAEGATVPFIARYRKEITGSLDEVAITAIRDRQLQLEELDARREAILASLGERNLLTDELQEKIAAAETISVLEDIYLPFRPKRRTRATIAREKGLEPLALRIFAQEAMDPEVAAAAFIDPEKGVESAEEALAGARDIIAEWVNEDQEARARMRTLFFEQGVLRSRVIAAKEKTGIKYKDYYDWDEAIVSAPSHRILAIRRGEREEVLSLRILPPEEEALAILTGIFIKGVTSVSEQVRLAVQDSYKRLLSGTMETEIRLVSKKRADEAAIQVFADNLRQLLSYVSGLGPALAENIVKHRDEAGPFRSRAELKKVRRLGPKAFEQAAGFLRIRDGVNPLDASAVHPESYPLVERMARDQACAVADLLADEGRRQRINPEGYVTDKVGLPTLREILSELAKPGRDPRRQFESVVFAAGIEKIGDLVAGMKLPGVVTNITAFGAFVDIGVHQDGLVHLSELADSFVKSPGDVVKVSQQVEVTVLAVDLERQRISLSMKKSPGERGDKSIRSHPDKPQADRRHTEKAQTGERRNRQDAPQGANRRPHPGQNRPAKAKEEPRPFHNPFADAFRKDGVKR
ncbi:MAG: protein Tex [Thermodesulfobacteriota bacterium]|nr:protein Tex [Thermodesulfobacteriota bacterium]